MTPEVKQKWIDALRSGKYKQGQGAMKRYDANADNRCIVHCCLGVLCEVLIEEGIEWTDFGNNKFQANFHDVFGGGVLPVTLAKTLNIKPGGELSRTDSLAQRNDDGHSFEEIATYLETAELPEYDAILISDDDRKPIVG